jgi:ribosome-interacting GTPase 1
MAKKTTLKEIGDMLAHVVKHMATKEDIADIRREMATKEQLAALHTQVSSIEAEIKHGRYETRLGNLEIKVFGAPGR